MWQKDKLTISVQRWLTALTDDAKAIIQNPLTKLLYSCTLGRSCQLVMNFVNLMRSGSAPQLMIAIQRSGPTVMIYPKKMVWNTKGRVLRNPVEERGAYCSAKR